MSTWKALEERLVNSLNLSHRPVSITICDKEPDGVPRLEGTQPSSCSFWRLAAEGQVFYTLPEDHYNCAIGAHVHNIPLPEERSGEVNETLRMMFDVNYIREEEVPQIAQLSATPCAVAYAPLGEAVMIPTVVMCACRPKSAMLLSEAARLARAGHTAPTLGRPTCMVIPASIASGSAVESLACIGNRVYTDIGDDELYVCIPGSILGEVTEALETILAANEKLEAYAQTRRQELSTK